MTQTGVRYRTAIPTPQPNRPGRVLTSFLVGLGVAGLLGLLLILWMAP